MTKGCEKKIVNQSWIWIEGEARERERVKMIFLADTFLSLEVPNLVLCLFLLLSLSTFFCFF